MAPIRKKPTTKKPSPPPIILSNGIKISNPTSSASRARRRSHLSRAALWDSTSSKQDIIDHAATFSPLSVAQYTWGPPTTPTIPATQSKRQHGGLKRIGFRRGKTSIYEQAMPPLEDNAPSATTHSKLLCISLEIREQIYRHLLLHSKPIVLHSDWKTVLRKSPAQNHRILRVCKQVAEEGARFLYARNRFVARVVERPAVSSMDGGIGDGFLKYLRNVTVVVPGEMREERWGREAGECVGRLAEEGACLESLSIVAGLGAGGSTGAIKFADFFAEDSSLHLAIARLTVKTLTITLRHPPNHNQKRTKFSINLWPLQVERTAEQSWLAGDIVAAQTRSEGVVAARLELGGLKGRIEGIMKEIEGEMGRVVEEEVVEVEVVKGVEQVVEGGDELVGREEDGIAT